MPFIGAQPSRGIIGDSSVTTAKINADAVTGAKIADDALDSEHYVDGSIDAAHIASSAVTTAKINADAVTGAKIADDALDSEHYTDGSIDAAHIASNAVTTAKINADAVTGAKIADDALDSEHYTDGSIDTAHLGDLQVTTAKIAADAITGAKIADDALDSEHYTDASIDTAHIATNAIDGTLTKDALIADYSDVTITASDLIMYGDATDSNNTKRDTVQGILDLASGGAWELVSTAVASSSSTIDITGIDSSADTWVVLVEGVNVSNDLTTIEMRTNSGSGFDSGASDYSWLYIGTHSGIYYDNYDSSDDHIRAGGDPFSMGNDATNAFSMKVTIHDPSDTTYETLIYYELATINNAANPVPQWLNGVGHRTGASACTGIQFLMSAGSFDTGRFSLFKIKHS
jgi:hypothetical protein